jgi:hypothetical protein
MQQLYVPIKNDGKLTHKESGSLGWLKTKPIHEAAFELRKQKYNSYPKLCLYCQSILCYEKRFSKFCNHTCSATFNNIKRGKLEKNCVCCDIKFIPKHKTTKFCSKQCEGEYKKESTIIKWKEGRSKGYNGKTMSVPLWLRRFLFEKYNSKCCKCGWCEINSTTNKIPLEVNHIDGDATNTKEENLNLLCPNCHSLTPNFRVLNKNSKRSRK